MMAENEKLPMVEKKHGGCGCGCGAHQQKDDKAVEPVTEESEK